MKQKEVEYSVDLLRDDYYKLKDELIPEHEVVEGTDVTEDLYDCLYDKLKNNEIINLCVQGEVISGKSLVGEALMLETNQNYKSLGTLPKGFDYMKHIVADQTEFLRVTNPDETHCCFLIDEWNRLSLTGINSTTEEKWYDYYSDVFAQKHISRISTSPSHVTDKNATIWLDVIAKDVESKTTLCRVRYHNIAEHSAMAIGHAKIDVSKALAQPWHERYRKKKFARMALLDEHGVRDIRELEFAELVLATYTDISKMRTKAMTNPNIIMSAVRQHVNEKRLVYSLIAYSDIANRVKTLADVDWETTKTGEQMEKLLQKGQEKGVENCRTTLKELANIKKSAIDYETTLCQVYDKYKKL